MPLSAPDTRTIEANKAFAERIPEPFREKPWLSEITKYPDRDHHNEFFNQFDNLQKRLGQKVELVVPGEGATEEQVKAFHKTLGVPESIDGYKIEPIQYAEEDKKYGEYLQAGRPEGFIADMKEAALKLGLTPKQFDGMFNAHDSAFIKHHREFVKSQMEAEAKETEEFDRLAQTSFGDRKDQVIESGKSLLSNLLPADSPWRGFFMKQSPEQIVGLAYVLNLVHQKYVQEDKGLSATQTILSGSNPREEAKKLMENPAYFDENHPQHESIRAKANALYKLEGTLGKK